MASWDEILNNIMGAIQGRSARPVNKTGVIIEYPERMSDEELAKMYGDEDWIARNGRRTGPTDPLNPTYDPTAKYGRLAPVVQSQQPPAAPAVAGLVPPTGTADNEFVQRRRPPQVRLDETVAEYDRWRNMTPEAMDQKKDSVWKNMGKQLLLGTRELADIPPNMQSKEQLGFAVGKMAARAFKGIVAPMSDEQEIIDYKRDEAMKKVAQAQGLYDLDLQNRAKEEGIDWSVARQEKAYAEMQKMKADSAAKLEAGRVAQAKLALTVYTGRDVFNPATNADDASIAATYRQNTGSILPVKEGKVKSPPNTFSKNGRMYTEITYVDSSKGDNGVVRGYVREDGTITQVESEAALWKPIQQTVAEISAGSSVYRADLEAKVNMARISAEVLKNKAANQLAYSNTRTAIRMLRGTRHVDGTPVTEEEIQDLLNKYAAENPGFVANE